MTIKDIRKLVINNIKRPDLIKTLLSKISHWPQKIAEVSGCHACRGHDISDGAATQNSAMAMHLLKFISLAAQNINSFDIDNRSNSKKVEQIKNIFQSRTSPINTGFTATRDARLDKLILEGRGQIHNVDEADGDQIVIGSFHKEFELRNATIRELGTSDAREISLFSCTIGRLNIGSDNLESLRLRGCSIGIMKFSNKESIPSIDISDSFFSDIEVSSASNPFGHTFRWNNNEVAIKRTPEHFRPASTLAQISKLLSEKHHTESALWFRSRELLREYASLSGVLRFFSCASWMASHHGTKPSRLVGWFFVVWLVSAVLVTISGGAVVNQRMIPDSGSAAVNQKLIADGHFWMEDINTPFFNSILLPLQATLNPLGIFSTKNVFVAQTALSHIFAAFAGLINDILLFVFIAQIRRYFKMT